MSVRAMESWEVCFTEGDEETTVTVVADTPGRAVDAALAHFAEAIQPEVITVSVASYQTLVAGVPEILVGN